MKILAVDDDKIALELLKVSLRCAGYENVDFCLSAKEALSLIDQGSKDYDCMLLDIVMPDMNGIELCQEVRSMREYESVPIIMITAVSDIEMLEGAIEFGATDYVNKPFDGLELGARLRTASLLSDAMKRSPKIRRTDREEHKKPNGPLLKFEDPFFLESKPNLIGQTFFWNEVMEQEILPQTTNIFSVAVVDAPRIFEALPNDTFREFVNELSGAMVNALNPWRPRVTYYGSGILLVMLLNAPSKTFNEIQEHMRSSIEKMPLISLSNYSKSVVLCIEHVVLGEENERRSVDALRKLFSTGADVKMANLAHQVASRQNILRSEILGRRASKDVMSWHLTLTGLRKRVKPRRVTKRTSIRADNTDPSYSSHVAKEKENLFSDLWLGPVDN